MKITNLPKFIDEARKQRVGKVSALTGGRLLSAFEIPPINMRNVADKSQTQQLEDICCNWETTKQCCYVGTDLVFSSLAATVESKPKSLDDERPAIFGKMRDNILDTQVGCIPSGAITQVVVTIMDPNDIEKYGISHADQSIRDLVTAQGQDPDEFFRLLGFSSGPGLPDPMFALMGSNHIIYRGVPPPDDVPIKDIDSIDTYINEANPPPFTGQWMRHHNRHASWFHDSETPKSLHVEGVTLFNVQLGKLVNTEDLYRMGDHRISNLGETVSLTVDVPNPDYISANSASGLAVAAVWGKMFSIFPTVENTPMEGVEIQTPSPRGRKRGPISPYSSPPSNDGGDGSDDGDDGDDGNGDDGGDRAPRLQTQATRVRKNSQEMIRAAEYKLQQANIEKNQKAQVNEERTYCHSSCHPYQPHIRISSIIKT